MKLFGLALGLSLFSGSSQAQPEKEIVTVNGTPIRQAEVLDRLWKRYGPETLDEMIDELLLRQAAQKDKLKAQPAEVDKRLAKLREQFPDPKIFQNQLEQNGLTIDKLKEDISDQVAREKLVAKSRRLSVSDEELKKAFADHKAELATPAALHLRHMLVAAEAEAKDLAAKVKAGGDFKALAKEKSLAPTGKINGGDYGFVSRGSLPPEIEQIAFSMKPNEVRLFPGEGGFHILQTLESRPAVPAEFGRVKDDLRELLLQQKIKQALPEYVRELRRTADIKMQ